MYAIALEPRQYDTYILNDRSAGSRVEVVPQRGGIITSWQVRGQELLYFDADRFADPSKSIRGGIPILFPICGDLPEDTYTDGDTSYALKRHGFARDLPWTVGDRVTQDKVSLTLELTSNDRTRAVYPFDFHLAFTYQLQGNTLDIQQCVTNRGDRPMPFSLGLHPYFSIANKAQLQLDIPSRQYIDQLNGATQVFGGNFDYSQDEIDVAFTQLDRDWTSATDRDRNLRIRLDYDSEVYSTVVFWTVKGKEYYCLEPWSAPRNALNTGDRLIRLDAGSRLETGVRLSAEFLSD